jgi:ubiquitin C-terminal hydrolase
VLINYVATSLQSHSFFLERDSSYGDGQTFLEFLINQAVFDELNQVGSKKFLLSTKDEDIELKKLMLTGILYLVRDSENKQAH